MLKSFVEKNLKVAVITGSSRGLGKEIALTLGESGYNVAVNYLASEKEAMKVADEIASDALLIKADVGDIKHVEKMAEAVYEKWGRVDVLVNNAGITKDNLMIKLKEEEWDEVLRVNLKRMLQYYQGLLSFYDKIRRRAYYKYLLVFRA